MGTFVEIHVYLAESGKKLTDDANLAISKAYQVIGRIQSMMSFHDENSMLSKLNANAFLAPVKVDPLMYALLERAQKIHDYSDGLFDCAVAPCLVEFGFLPQHQYMKENIHRGGASQRDIILLPKLAVQFKRPLCIDLGGIAKGFAVDLAVHVLRAAGIKNAVVNAGGDLRVFGKIAEEIYIRNPVQPEQVKVMGRLLNGAMATSASYFTKKIYKKQQVSHIVDPLNQTAVVSDSSFTVLASQAWLADALTKVLMLNQNVEHRCFQRFGAQAVITGQFKDML